MQNSKQRRVYLIKVQDSVVHQYYPDKGIGKVLLQEELYGQSYYLVYFEHSKENLRCHETELQLVALPLDNARRHTFSDPLPFLLFWEKEKLLAEKSSHDIQTISNFKLKPLPHQILAVDFVLNQFKPRALIADEVGLGKTIEAGLIFEELKARSMLKRVLIIAPSGLCRQWKDEMKQKFFEDFVHYDRNTILSLKNIHGQETNVWKLHPYIITSIDFIKPRSNEEDASGMGINKKSISFHEEHIEKAILEASFDLVIIDEAHKLSKDSMSGTTARYKIGNALAEVSPFFLLLTATPHQGKESRFRNLLHLIDPYQFYTNCTLTPAKVKSITVRNNKRAVTDMEGNRLFKHRITSVKNIFWSLDTHKIEIELYAKVSEYVTHFYNLAIKEQNHTFTFLLMIFQRMLSSSSRAIGKSLSKRLENLSQQLIVLEDLHKETKQAKNYTLEELEELHSEDQLEDIENKLNTKYYLFRKIDLETEIEMLKECVNLANLASRGRLDAKMTELLYLLDEFKRIENDPKLKFIIFTEFVETQKFIQEVLEQHGFKTALINGSMSLDCKVEQREFFRNEAQVLISTDAGGEGVNLQFCRIMIQYDLPWNPMRLEQRIGRIDRIGQEYDVKIVNLQLPDTIEFKVRKKIEEKLMIIQKEFMQDENKMADILSTLDSEFNFESIYVDAVLLRNMEAQKLDELAQEMYEKAKEIIKTDEMLLPYSEWTHPSPLTTQNIQRSKMQAKNLLHLFLQTEKSELKTSSKDQNLMQFIDPLSKEKKKPLKTVFFDPELSADYDQADLLTLEHPYMQTMFRHIDTRYQNHNCAIFQICHQAFAGKKGWCFNYRFTLTNHVDPKKMFIVSCFIDEDKVYHRRISNYIQTLTGGDLQLLENHSYKSYPIEDCTSIAHETIEKVSFELYKKNEEQLHQKIQNELQKIVKYYQDRKQAIEQVAIENIKKGLMIQMEEERKNQTEALEKRKHLIPTLDCFQIAFIEFVP